MLFNLQIVSNILMNQGFIVQTEENGKQALNTATKIKPDLILLDIMMPEMDSFETCQKLKLIPETKNIPIIFLSALEKSEDISKGFQYGAVDYITKPFKELELLERVNKHIELKKIRENLLKMNLLQKAIFNSIPDTIIAVDKELQLITTNKKVKNIYKKISSKSPYYQILNQTLITQQPVKENYISLKTKEGQDRMMIANTTPLIDPEKGFIGVLLLIRDITRLNELEKQLSERYKFNNIVGKNKKMQQIYYLLVSCPKSPFHKNPYFKIP